MALRWDEPGPRLNTDMSESVSNRPRGRQQEHKASSSQAAHPVRRHGSSSESFCGSLYSVQSNADAAAEVLHCMTPEADFTTPEACRQHTEANMNARSSDGQLAQKLLEEEEVCLGQSQALPKESIWHSSVAAAPLPTISPGAGHSNCAMRSMLLKEAQAARLEALAKAEIAANLVAKAQRLARIAKADAAGRLELQRSASATASSLHRGDTEQKHLGRTALVSQSCVTHAANARRVHSKTRAGVAALATRKAHQPQALSAGHSPTNTQPQQQQQQQQQHWVPALPKESSSECSTAFSAFRHAHAGTKRSQEAASLPTADPLHTPCKSCRVNPVLPSSPAQVGTCRRRHALTQQAAEDVTAPNLGLNASQPSKVCQMPASDCSSPCSSCCMVPECQQGSGCHFQSANCQQSCRPGLHAHMHRQNSRDSACRWTDTGADASCVNSGLSDSTTLLACIKSKPRGEKDTQHETGLQFPILGHAQRMDRRQSAHPETSETAAALRQQHQLHMIDLMLARVSAAEEAIHMGLAQSDSCFQRHHNPWEPAGSCNMLHHEMICGTHGENDFPDIDPLLLCAGQPAECKLEEFAVMDKSSFKDASSVNGSDNMVEGCTERTHSSSGSSIECLGRFLVPTDWLNDGSDEVDLDYFSTMSNDDSMLGLALPLMPPSL